MRHGQSWDEDLEVYAHRRAALQRVAARCADADATGVPVVDGRGWGVRRSRREASTAAA